MKAFLGFLLSLLLAVSAFAASEGPGIDGVAALKLLQQGNARFVRGAVDHPHQDFMRRQETADKGQKPFACILSCSDSRVPVEQLFDQGIGDVFVVRVAGNVAATNETATVEYGLGVLNIPLLIVLGHSHCGAVTATVQNAQVPGSIPYLVKSIVPAVETAKKNNPGASQKALVDAATKANIWQAVADIYKNSPIVAEKVKTNKVKVVGAYYDLDTGKVTWLGEHPDQAKLIPAVSK